MIMVKMVIWTLLEGFRMSLNILFCFCRSILHVNVFTLHVIQVQQKLVIHRHLKKLMTELPSFAFKEVDDGNLKMVKNLSMWDGDLQSPSSLRHEISVWKRKRSIVDSIDSKFDNLVECLSELDGNIFPN